MNWTAWWIGFVVSVAIAWPWRWWKTHLMRRPLYWRPAWSYPRQDLRRFMCRPFYVDMWWDIQAKVLAPLGYCEECGAKGSHKFRCSQR